MVALSMAALIATAGLATDFSIWFAQRRDLQAVTDAAALAAASLADDPAAATAAANGILRANGFDPAATVVSLDTGYYCPDVTVAPKARFAAAACAALPVTVANAVRVSTHRVSRSFLLRALGTPGSRAPLEITSVAVATRINQAGLAAGTGVAALNPALANAALQSLLGTSISLTAVQYDGLANAHVDALSFLGALATQLNVRAGTYNQLLQTQASVGDVLTAAVNALDQPGQTAEVTAAISGLRALEGSIQGNPQVTLGQLFDLGVWGNTPLDSGSQVAALHAGLNLYQLATFSLELDNGSHAVTIPSSTLGIPNLASLTVASTAIEPPQQASFAFGPEGVQVHTAQVRLQLNLQVLNLAGVLGTGVQLPLYVEVGSGDARITDISCSGNPAQDAQVKVAAQSGLASIYIGKAPSGAMTNFSQPVPASSITPVPIIGLGIPGVLSLVDTTAKAVVTAQSPMASLTFSQPGAPLTDGVIGSPPWSNIPGAQGAPARVSSGVPLASTLDSLANSLSMRVCVLTLLGACIGQSTLTGSQLGPLFTVLDPVLGSLDVVIEQLLTALGAQIGYMDTDVTGVRCGLPVLVY